MTGGEDAANAVTERWSRLVNATARPYISFAKRALVAIVVSTIVAIAAALVIPNVALAELVAVSGTVFVTILVLGPIWDSDASAAALFYEHFDTERATWRRETGTRLPRGRAALRRWLEAHPDSAHAISVLLALGRLEEADRLIEAVDPSTPLDVFDRELSRQTSALLAGGEPDLSTLQRLWSALSVPAERRLRGECLALFEAEVAFDRGGDPVPIMGAAWRALASIPGRTRVQWALLLFPIVGVPLVTGLLVRLLTSAA